MGVVRFLVRLVAMVLEIGAVVGIVWLGFNAPLYLAGLAFSLALVLGLALERARLMNEIGFYFGRAGNVLSTAGASLALVEAGMKALLAGVVTLLTFSGTDPKRLFIIAVIFGASVFAGSSLLRRLSLSFGANPSRWGYFRLAAPLGLVYSAAIQTAETIKVGGAALLPVPNLAGLAKQLFFDVPARPSLAQASELLFLLKQKFDDIVVSMLEVVMPPTAAQIVGVLVSINTLTGFAIGVFAVAIAAMVQELERAGGG